jgi:hypothetical protein
MDDHIAKVHDEPAVAGEAFLFALLAVPLPYIFHHGIREGIQHAVAGAGADDEVICKGDDFLEVDQDDIFTLLILKGIYDFTSKFQCFQISPHKVMSL